MGLLDLELAQAGFDEVELALALLHELGRFHEPPVDALALGIDLVDVGLKVLAAPFLGFEFAALAVEPFAGLVGSKRALRSSQPWKGDGTGQNTPQGRQPPRARYVLAQCALNAQSALDGTPLSMPIRHAPGCPPPADAHGARPPLRGPPLPLKDRPTSKGGTLKRQCRPIGRGQRIGVDREICRNTLQKFTSIVAWMSWRADRQARCCRKPLTALVLAITLCVPPKRTEVKPDRSHAERSEICHDAGGGRRVPGLAGRVLEYDARFQPQPQPKVDAMARWAAVSRHHDCHDPGLLAASVRGE